MTLWWPECVSTRIERQDLQFVDQNAVKNQSKRMLKRYPDNRLVQHLIERCVNCYGCPAARNFVLERWECPVPTSPTCNADCVGCISEQPKESGVVSPQQRMQFVPDVAEIIEFTVPHLEHAPRAVISFGQGCEGEPCVGDVLEETIKAIRKRTSQGIINLNTNASQPATVERLFKAGLDSMRVSLNSAQPELYAAYYQPRNYAFEQVRGVASDCAAIRALEFAQLFCVSRFYRSSAGGCRFGNAYSGHTCQYDSSSQHEHGPRMVY